MDIHTSDSTKSELYQFDSKGLEGEHIASSGNLNLGMLYRNHGEDRNYLPFDYSSSLTTLDMSRVPGFSTSLLSSENLGALHESAADFSNPTIASAPGSITTSFLEAPAYSSASEFNLDSDFSSQGSSALSALSGSPPGQITEREATTSSPGMDGVPGAAGDPGNPGDNGSPTIINETIQNVTEVTNTATDIVNSTVTEVSDTVTNVTQMLDGVLPEPVGDVVNNLLSPTQDILSSTVSNVENSLTHVTEVLNQSLLAPVETVLDNLVDGPSPLLSSVTQTTETLVENSTQVVEQLVSNLASPVEILTNPAETLLDPIVDLASSATEVAEDLISQVQDILPLSEGIHIGLSTDTLLAQENPVTGEPVLDFLPLTLTDLGLDAGINLSDAGLGLQAEATDNALLSDLGVGTLTGDVGEILGMGNPSSPDTLLDLALAIPTGNDPVPDGSQAAYGLDLSAIFDAPAQDNTSSPADAQAALNNIPVLDTDAPDLTMLLNDPVGNVSSLLPDLGTDAIGDVTSILPDLGSGSSPAPSLPPVSQILSEPVIPPAPVIISQALAPLKTGGLLGGWHL